MKTVELKQKPNQDVIESLERALEKAKNGEIQGFIMVRQYANGSGNTWSGLSRDQVPKLLGEILLMAVQLSHATDGVDEDDINC